MNPFFFCSLILNRLGYKLGITTSRWLGCSEVKGLVQEKLQAHNTGLVNASPFPKNWDWPAQSSSVDWTEMKCER